MSRGSGVWTASRGAMRRRRVQTAVIGLVALVSTATVVLALGLLAATSGPFEQVFGSQRGPHVVAAYDLSKVAAADLEQTTHRPGVTAAAGPFQEATITVAGGLAGFGSGTSTVVGRSSPDTPVDRVQLWSGHWVSGPGQVVINLPPGRRPRHAVLGATVTLPNGVPLTVVGLAYSMADTAQAWVSPDQIAALHPTYLQMLYRFSSAANPSELRTSMIVVNRGLPSGALVNSQSYLQLKQSFDANVNTYVPFLMTFGLLGLLVGVLIVSNVVSGAVLSGSRHIGTLKALGFTPNQVAGVYVLLVGVPTIAGTVLGTIVGARLAETMLGDAFRTLGRSTASLAPWTLVVGPLGVLAVVVLAALAPALRAHRLSAVDALTTGAANARKGGGRVQRWLSGIGLPRTISLGLAIPLARPGRSLMTMAAVLLGVATVTLSAGLTNSLVQYGRAVEHTGAVQVVVNVGDPAFGQTAPSLDDRQIQALLRALPGTAHVTAETLTPVHVAGASTPLDGDFLEGDSATLGYVLVHGHWLSGPGQAVVSPAYLRAHGQALGDTVTLGEGSRIARLTIVGETMSGNSNEVITTWDTLQTVQPGTPVQSYSVQLTRGTDPARYAAKIHARGLSPQVNDTVNAGTVTIVAFASVFTLLLVTVAALGVFNTVVLHTRERRRDLGVLKSIGMTPWQVTSMVVLSMAVLGAVSGLVGLPLGIVAHRLLAPAMAGSSNIVLPPKMMHVWDPVTLAMLVPAGVVVAALGAFLPARSAARLTVGQVLRTE